MPVDPTLYPTAPDPQARMAARLAAMEARLAAMEAKRDTVFTPIPVGPSGATFTWYGGRLYVFWGGYVNGTGSGQVTVAVNINGVLVANLPVNVFGASTVSSLPLVTSLINPTTVGLSTSSPNTVTASVSAGPGQLPSVYGLAIEWPQA